MSRKPGAQPHWLAVWCDALWNAAGIPRLEAIWDTPTHVGLQIIHAHEQREGNRRKWSHSLADAADPSFQLDRSVKPRAEVTDDSEPTID